MAEILVFVTGGQRPDDQFQDGDVVCAFNQRRIRSAHAQHICDHRAAGFNAHGLRPLGGLAQEIRERCREYRFDRVSSNEVIRTTLETGTQELFVIPNLYLYLLRRRGHANHAVFGADGAEVWYGGKYRFTNPQLDQVWARIEADTPLREVDHRLWPLTPDEKRQFLAIPTIDMRDEIVARAESPEIDYDPLQPEFDVEAGIGNKVTRMRRSNINWRAMGLSPAQVLNQGVELDLRLSIEPQATTNLTAKPRKTIWSVTDHLRPRNDAEYFV